MRILLGSLFPLFFSLSALSAHPAVGIVMDKAGAVYYSDTTRVWRIAPNGEKTVAVPSVHTHELWLDDQGNLYGDHEAGGDGWTHRIWKRSPDGRVTDVIPARRGQLEDYKDFSLSRDSVGAMYWCSRGPGVTITKRNPSGLLTTFAGFPQMPEAGWMSVLPDGSAYLSDHGSLIRIDPDGKSRPLPVVQSAKQERYSIMRVWTDPSLNLYIADYASATIRKLGTDGRVSTVYSLPVPWQPTAGFIAPDGSLWILETSPTNAQQVRRVSPSGQARVY